MKADIGFTGSRKRWLEWTAWKLVPAPGSPEGELPEVTCRAAFDPGNLYLRADVRPLRGAHGERSWRYGDGFQVVISPDAVDEETSRFVVFGFGIEAGRPQALVVNRNGVWFPGPLPPGVRLAVRPVEGGAVYDMTLPWSAVPPLQGLLDEAIGLNVTYVARVPATGGRAVLQLVEDPGYDDELRSVRRVARIGLDVGQPQSTAVRARLDRTFGIDGTAAVAEIAILTGRSSRAELVAEVFQDKGDRPQDAAAPVESVPVPGPAGPVSRRRLARSLASYTVYPGANRYRHDWRAAALGTGPHSLDLEVSVNGRVELRQTLPYYSLRTDDVASLKLLYERAAARAPGRLSPILPSVAARFEWLDRLTTALDPSADPAPLRSLFDELVRMTAALEAGRDPFAGRAGHQRRSFRSKIDGSLQPYSVHVPPVSVEAPGERRPLLVLLRGSGVDEVGAATDPRLVPRLDEHGCLLCAPFGRDLDDWYLGDGGRDIFEALDAARAILPVDDRAVFLAGHSMGGYGVWRHGLANHRRFAGLVVISGFTHPPAGTGREPDDPARYLGRVEGLPVFVTHGLEDRVAPIGPTREFVDRLREAGADVRYREIAAAAHFDYDPWPEVFAWMETVLARRCPREQASPAEGNGSSGEKR